MPTIDPGYFAAFNWAWIGLAVVVFVALFFVTAPYGRHLRAGWGPMLPARLGWMVMEATGVVVKVLRIGAVALILSRQPSLSVIEILNNESGAAIGQLPQSPR